MSESCWCWRILLMLTSTRRQRKVVFGRKLGQRNHMHMIIVSWWFWNDLFHELRSTVSLIKRIKRKLRHYMQLSMRYGILEKGLKWCDVIWFLFLIMKGIFYRVLKKLLSTQPHPADISHAQDIKTPALLRLWISFQKETLFSLRNSWVLLGVNDNFFILFLAVLCRFSCYVNLTDIPCKTELS